MTNILVLGANGRIARLATDMFLDETDARLTLYLRNAGRLDQLDRAHRVRVVEGDVLDMRTLEAAKRCSRYERKQIQWDATPVSRRPSTV